LMGDGFRRILSLSLAISQSAGQRVMIDEFETGIHHSNLATTWAHVAKLARREKVQLFVTTHSWECLVAAEEALADEFAEDVAYYRLETDENGDFAMDFSFESLADALERRVEIR
jgi:AAA15 family ATPase/GTPase